jgi:hypothetical protein
VRPARLSRSAHQDERDRWTLNRRCAEFVASSEVARADP